MVNISGGVLPDKIKTEAGQPLIAATQSNGATVSHGCCGSPAEMSPQLYTSQPVSSNGNFSGTVTAQCSPVVKQQGAACTESAFNQLTLPCLEYENKKMSLFGDVSPPFHYADFTEIGNYRTENTLNGEIEIYLDVQPLFDPNYNPLYVSN